MEAGWHKILDTGAATDYIGVGIFSFWQHIAAVPAPPAKPTIGYDWYRGFIQLLIDGHMRGNSRPDTAPGLTHDRNQTSPGGTK